MNDNNGETVIDLFELLGLFIKKIWLVIILTIIGGVVAFGYSFLFIKPLYKSSALMYVNNSDISVGSTSFSISSTEINAAKSLVSTYTVILKSRSVINEVIRVSGVNYSYDKLASMVDAKAVNDTQVFSITVTSVDPQEAELLANTIANILPEKISSIVNGSDVKVVDYAVIASHRSSPSYTKNTIIGALIGFIISAFIIIVGYIRDDIIHSEDYLTKTYPDIPLLTVVPDLITSRQNGYGYYSTAVARGGDKVRKTYADSASSVIEQKTPFVIDAKSGSDGDKNG